MRWYIENMKSCIAYFTTFGIIVSMLGAFVIVIVMVLPTQDYLHLLVLIPWFLSWGIVVQVVEKIWAWGKC